MRVTPPIGIFGSQPASHDETIGGGSRTISASAVKESMPVRLLFGVVERALRVAEFPVSVAAWLNLVYDELWIEQSSDDNPW